MTPRTPARVAGTIAAALAAACTLLLVAPSSPAAAEGVVYLCPKSSGYDCMPGTGYTGQSVWNSYGPGHNCVSYAAYMLQRNGSPRPWEGRLGNGSDWDEHARAAGYVVDTTPAPGAIAQWDGGSGHVAYVEEVTDEHIVITEDAYAGFSSARLIPRTSSDFLEAEFLHIRDLPAAPADDVLWLDAEGATSTVWAGGASGPTPRPPGPAPEGLAPDQTALSGDLDGDGASDLLLVGAPGERTHVAWGDGDGGFRATSVRRTPADGEAVPVVADLDGDDADDVLWYGPGATPDLVWWGTPGSRGVTEGPASLTGTYVPAAGDVDGDGVDDVILAGPRDATDRAIWGAAGERRLLARRLPPARILPDAVPAVADFDGDGADDVAWLRSGSGRDAIWWGGPTREPVVEAIDVAAHAAAHAGDLDGDGLGDLLLTGEREQPAQVLRGTPERLILPGEPLAAPASATAVVADLADA